MATRTATAADDHTTPANAYGRNNLMADGNIQAARTRLGRAVQKLCAPRPLIHYHHTLYAPSLYQCLQSDLAGTQGDTRTPAKSLPPIWLDASMLLQDIDTQTIKWAPIPGDTPQRLQRMASQTFRPQDTDTVNSMAGTVDGWSESVMNLLDPESRKYISGAACPSCGKQTVYRKDSAGETVRQPALKLVVSQGCTCQCCGAFWAPDKFLFLGRLLGHEIPEGVLE